MSNPHHSPPVNPQCPRGILRKPSNPSLAFPTSRSMIVGDTGHTASRKRNSVPTLTGFPSPSATRDRFVSLPTAMLVSSRKDIDWDRDRSAKACGQVPSPIIIPSRKFSPPSGTVPSAPCQPNSSADLPPSERDAVSAPALPTVVIRRIVRRIKATMRPLAEKPEDHLDMEEVQAVHDRAKEDMERQSQLRATGVPSDCPPLKNNCRVFGASIRDVFVHASTPIVVGGFRHELPVVVVACVEELYRTGIYTPGLFRVLPNRERHIETVKLFDSRSSAYGVGVSLSTSSTPDICAVLSTFLVQLPEPILDKTIFFAFWAWCVKPSVKRENEERDGNERRDEEYQRRLKEKYQRMSPRSTYARARRNSLRRLQLIEEKNERIEAEERQIALTALLFRLLPPANYSLLVYLLAFFTQVPLCPENGMQFADIGNMFGHKMLGGPSLTVATKMTTWLLTRWPRISEVLAAQEETEQRRQEGNLIRKVATTKADADGDRAPFPDPVADELSLTRDGSAFAASVSEYADTVPESDEGPSDGEAVTLGEGKQEAGLGASVPRCGEDEVVLAPSEGLFAGEMSDLGTSADLPEDECLSPIDSPLVKRDLGKRFSGEFASLLARFVADDSQGHRGGGSSGGDDSAHSLHLRFDEGRGVASVSDDVTRVGVDRERMVEKNESGNDETVTLRRRVETLEAERDRAHGLLGEISRMIDHAGLTGTDRSG